MHLITITGGKASGKDMLIDSLIEHFSKLHLGKVSRAIFSHTRAKRDGDRPGENIHLLSQSEFDNQVSSGDIIFTAASSKANAGYSKNEFTKNEIVFVNIGNSYITPLRQHFKNEDVKILNVYIDVSRPVRATRLHYREGLGPVEIEEQLESDRGVIRDKREYSKYNLVVENKEGHFAETVERLTSEIEKFIAS